MKKFMSTVVAGAALLAVFGVSSVAHAATLNTDPQDYNTLRVGNYTVSPNSSSSNWTTSVSASPGDTIDLAIYYHNTGTDTAHNVRVRVVPQSTGVGTTQTFTAYVWADNASQVSGSATVTISSSQSLAYQNNVVWRPNQTTWGSQTLLNGQTGAEIFTSNGLLLGDIAPGWSTQGNVIVAFLVSNTGNNQSNLSVSTQSATGVTSTSATLNGSFTSNTSNTTTWFQWGTSGFFGTDTAHRTQGSSGSFNEYLSGLSQNTLYYYRAVGQASDGTIVYGNTQSFLTTGSGGCTYNCYNNNLPSVSTQSINGTADGFAILQGYVNPNGSSDTTRWFEWGYSTSLGFTTTKLSQGSSTGNFTDTVTNLSPNTTYYYRAVAQNSAGVVYGTTLSFTTQYGNNNPCYNCNNNTYYQTPFVSTQDATNVTYNFATLNGYVNPNNGCAYNNYNYNYNYGYNYSYNSTCNNYNYNNSYQNTSVTRWFEWGTTQNLGNTTARVIINATGPTNFSDTISGLAPNTTYYFRAAAQSFGGTAYGTILSFSTNGGGNYYYPSPTTGTPPQAITTLATDVAATSAKVNGIALIYDGITTQGWFEWGTTQNFGSQTSTATIGSAPSLAYSGILSGLSPNTTYYYRAVVQNSSGTNRGSTLSFTTSGGSVYTPPVVVEQPPRVITNTIVVGRGTVSPVELSIVGPGDTIVPGQTIGYTVHYQNKGKVKLTNAALRVMLPTEMQFVSGSRGNFTTKDNVLTVIVGDLNPNDSGDVTLQAQVLPQTPVGKQIVTTATLVYTDTSNNTQGDAIAYAVHTITGAQSALAASSLGLGGFLPSSLLGWLILLVLIILIVFLIISIQHARSKINNSRTI